MYPIVGMTICTGTSGAPRRGSGKRSARTSNMRLPSGAQSICGETALKIEETTLECRRELVALLGFELVRAGPPCRLS